MGKESDSPTATLSHTYLTRAREMGRSLGVAGPELSVVEAPRALSGAARQKKEAQLLADAALPGGDIVLLDERGKDLTSRGWADLVGQARDNGVRGLTFMIGGADGFDAQMPALLAPRPVRKVALGKATWPHMMIRAMVAEQLYRSMTILAGHPYHRD